MNHLISACRLKILDKDITFITNSLLLKKNIEGGFSNFLKDGEKRPPLRISLILKDTQDIRNVISSILKLTHCILKDIQDKYWIFHASAFSQDGGATIMLGDSNAGKSSLCFAAGLSGARIISDEPVLIDKENYLVVPFRYLIKLDGFCHIFSKWSFAKRFDINCNRFIRKGKFETLDFNLFTKEELSKLGIEVEDKKIPIKNIILLEDKRYDTVIHLYKHCLNKGQKPNFQNLFRDLNSFSHGKRIVFLPGVAKKLKDEKKIKNILNTIRHM